MPFSAGARLNCDHGRLIGGHAMLVMENTSARLIALHYRHIPEAASWTRRERCLKNAQALQAYCNQGATL